MLAEGNRGRRRPSLRPRGVGTVVPRAGRLHLLLLPRQFNPRERVQVLVEGFGLGKRVPRHAFAKRGRVFVCDRSVGVVRFGVDGSKLESRRELNVEGQPRRGLAPEPVIPRRVCVRIAVFLSLLFFILLNSPAFIRRRRRFTPRRHTRHVLRSHRVHVHVDRRLGQRRALGARPAPQVPSYGPSVPIVALGGLQRGDGPRGRRERGSRPARDPPRAARLRARHVQRPSQRDGVQHRSRGGRFIGDLFAFGKLRGGAGERRRLGPSLTTPRVGFVFFFIPRKSPLRTFSNLLRGSLDPLREGQGAERFIPPRVCIVVEAVRRRVTVRAR